MRGEKREPRAEKAEVGLVVRWFGGAVDRVNAKTEFHSN